MAGEAGAVGGVFLEAFHWNASQYEQLLQIDVMKDMVRRAILVQRTAISIMGQVPPPSPPGSPPAVRTGTLRRSITWRPGLDAISPYVDIGSALEYAIYLENGTSRMAARPFLKPALESARATWI